MITIVDTYEDVLRLSAATGGRLDAARWEEYAAGVHPALPQMIYRSNEKYGDDPRLTHVVEAALARPDLLAEAHASFLQAADGLDARASQALGSIDCQLILYLGLCNGAGWVTRVGGRQAILIGLEKVVELGWHTPQAMMGLIYHEVGHVWHFQNGRIPTPATPREKALWQLFSEGIAEQAETHLGPGRGPHRGAAWLDWCLAHEAQAKREYLGRMARGDSIQDFFGDWCSWQGTSDVGYFLGRQFVGRLLSRHSMDEIIGLSLDALDREFAVYAEN